MFSKIKGYINNVTNYDYLGFFNEVSNFIADNVNDTYTSIKETRTKMKDIGKCNFELGVYHYQQGNFFDSILRFKMCLFFNSRFHDEIHFYLARIYSEKNDFYNAEYHLAKYQASGSKKFQQNAEYLSSLIMLFHKESAEITGIPQDFLQLKHERLAKDTKISPEDFTKLDGVSKFILKCSQESEKLFANTLHMGCKHGYLGYLLNLEKLYENIVGVEISKELCKVAASHYDDFNKKIYNIVHSNLPEEFFNKKSIKKLFDLVILDEVFDYIKNPKELIDESFKHLKKKGFLCLITRSYDGVEFFNYKSEQFYHTINNMKGNCEEHGKLLDEEEIAMPAGNLRILMFEKK